MKALSGLSGLSAVCGAGVVAVGPNSPGSGADAGGGSVTWSNPGAITASDDSRATALLNNLTSNALQATNFGFAIPGGSTVRGIEIRLERSASGAGLVQTASLRSLKAGTAVGDEVSGDNWPASDAVATFGGPTDLWGTTWSAADINHAGFGVQLQAVEVNEEDTTARVDCVTVTVYYS